ncbi:MAG: phosphoribosylglycinamide formyltransferase [Candidatus Nanopelagicales bacterium]
MVARLVVLASGSGTLLQALIDASAQGTLPARVVAVGSDVPGCLALQRAAAAGIETFACAPREFADRGAWDLAIRDALLAFRPTLVVSAGFMRILGADVVDAFAGRIVNAHPALLPSFPGAHPVREALAHGVKVTGCTVHVVDHGVDTGPILAQRAVEVRPGDDEASLHERIKHEERLLLVQTVTSLIGERA